MSRVTAPVSKLSRSLGSTTVSIGRSGSKAAAASGRIHQHDVDGSEHVHSTRHLTTSTTNTLAHRPVASHARKVPLMQGFRTSAPKPARLDPSPIDFAVLPNLEGPRADPYAGIRVPLLPDAAYPALHRAVEQPDAPLARPEILVVAANPDAVMPSALTEVEGMGVDGVELKFAHDLDRVAEKEPGMIRDLWKGMVEDLFGGPQKPTPA